MNKLLFASFASITIATTVEASFYNEALRVKHRALANIEPMIHFGLMPKAKVKKSTIKHFSGVVNGNKKPYRKYGTEAVRGYEYRNDNMSFKLMSNPSQFKTCKSYNRLITFNEEYKTVMVWDGAVLLSAFADSRLSFNDVNCNKKISTTKEKQLLVEQLMEKARASIEVKADNKTPAFIRLLRLLRIAATATAVAVVTP